MSKFGYCIIAVVNKTRNGTEWNGMEKLIKHGTELLSRHKVLPRTHGSLSYTHENLFVHARGFLTRLAGNGCTGSRLLAPF